MPDLVVTVAQASRLFGVDHVHSRRILDTLVNRGILSTDGRQFARAGPADAVFELKGYHGGAPRVVIVDDHTLLTEALRRLLEPDCEVVGTYDDPRAFLRDVARLRPDVAVLDISMPTLNGLDAARTSPRLPSARIVFLTMNEDADVAAEAFRVGASRVSAEAVGRHRAEGGRRGRDEPALLHHPLLTRDWSARSSSQRTSGGRSPAHTRASAKSCSCSLKAIR